MMIHTTIGVYVDAEMLCNYFHTLVNRFFKILPLWEEKENSLPMYLESLQSELIGCGAFIDAVGKDAMVLSLASILQYFIDNPSCEPHVVKREVFRAISLCNKLKDKYAPKKEEMR